MLSDAEKRRRHARKGGKGRARKLTPERRREIARLGGLARREKRRAEPGEFKRRVAALVLVIYRGFSAADIERHFGWQRGDVENWIQAGRLLW